jgi:hypothetical protein
VVDECKGKLGSAQEACRHAKEEVKSHTAEAKAILKEKDAAVAVVQQIEKLLAEVDTIRGVIIGTKEEQGAALKKSVTKVMSQLRQTGAEQGLLACGESALSSGTRSGFDWLVIDTMCKHLESHKAATQEKLAAQLEVVAKIDESLVPLKAATDNLSAAKGVESAAQEALQNAEQVLEDAMEAVACVEKDFVAAEATCVSCHSERAEFEDVMSAFRMLQTRGEAPAEDVGMTLATGTVAQEGEAAEVVAAVPVTTASSVGAAEEAKQVPLVEAQTEHVVENMEAVASVRVPAAVEQKYITPQVPVENQENVPVNVLGGAMELIADESL